MFRSLQSRFTASFVAVLVSTVVALGVGVVVLFDQSTERQYRATFDKDSAAICFLFQDSLANGVILKSEIDLGQLSKVVQDLSNKFSMRIQVNFGVIKPTGYTPPRPGPHFAVDHFQSAPCVPLLVNARPGLVLTTSRPWTDRAWVQGQFLQTVIWIGIAACLLAIFIGGILAERLTAPLRVLTRATTRMSAGHLQERVPEGHRDEAGELAHQFNRMAARLQESFATISADRDRLRQFVADVSHELRTPLTALRTFNDLLQDGAGEDPATRHDFLGESARQIERLDWLTHNLLDLSRLDAGITKLALQSADLSETLRRAVETNRPAADQKDVTLAVEAPLLVAPHDPPRLEQAIGNVVSNAVKFSPRGATVRARLYREGDQAVLEVSDEGPGIPPEEAPHIFERFYRGNDANRAGEGSGLGLAIARAVQEAHHGAIAVQSVPGRGATMRLTLPMAPDHDPVASGQ